MPKTFKIGDHVRWNSEAGRVSGLIIKKITSDTKFKGYVHHASREAPQFLIQSDKTEHVAIHKGTALRLIPTRARKSGSTAGAKGTPRQRKRCKRRTHATRVNLTFEFLRVQRDLCSVKTMVPLCAQPTSASRSGSP
jgi:hypothetical protein